MRGVLIGIAMSFFLGLGGIAQEQKDVKLNQRNYRRDTIFLHQKSIEELKFDFEAVQMDKPELELNYQLTNQAKFKGLERLKRSMIIPAALVGVGLYSGHPNNTNAWMGKRAVHESIQEQFEGFHSPVDDYLQWGPIAMCYGLKACGVKGANNLWTSTKLLIKAELLTATVVRFLKNTTDNPRPGDRGGHSFPSGHTSQAFVAATFLHREYGHLNPLYSLAGYTMATTVGAMRMMNRRHWFNDVTVGAALGITFTNLIYWQHERQNDKKKRKLAAIPSFTSKGAAVSMLMQF